MSVLDHLSFIHSSHLERRSGIGRSIGHVRLTSGIPSPFSSDANASVVKCLGTLPQKFHLKYMRRF